MAAKKKKGSSGFSYTVRHGFPIREQDGEKLARELHRLTKKNGGMLTAKDLLIEAEDPSSPFHRYIQWDNKKAAHHYRLMQARRILTCIEYEVKSGKTVVNIPAFVRVINDGALPNAKPGMGYVTTATAAEETSFQDQVLARAINDAKMYAERYRRFNEVFTTLKPIFEAIAKVEKIVERKAKTG